nr:MAG TPA: hypothetical protein [Microviridae sp.]
MDNSRFFLSNLNEYEYYLSQIKVNETNSHPILNGEIIEIIDIVAPKNPITGNRDNDVSMLLSQNISSIEKQAILSRMSQIPPSQRHDLSDAELLDMLPSRYNSTYVDADAVRQYFNNNILSSDSGEIVETSASSEPNQAD